MIRNPVSWFCALFGILLGIATSPSLAQDPSSVPSGGTDATIILEGPTQQQVRLAFPAAEIDPSVSQDLRYAAQEIESTLRDDLELSNTFNAQGPTELSVLVLTGSREHDFEQFRSLGNDVVLLLTIKAEGPRLVLEGRVYDLPSRQSIAGKRYRGEAGQARRLAHTMADELHRIFTGRPGIALTSLVFHSTRGPFQELFLMDYDGRNQRQISAHQSTSGFPDWSPQNDAIAYISYLTGNPGIYLVELGNSRKQPIFSDGTLNLSPSFSPDGQRVVFSHSDEKSNIDIYVCERNCTSPQRLTKSRGIDTNPTWSPSGNQIAFTSDRSGRPNVYVMKLDGSEVRRISFEGEYNDGAAWRPDGSHLAYATRERGKKFQIAVTSLVDLQNRILTQGRDSHEEPTFSPDGQYIAFTLKRGKESQIYMINANGGNLRQLTHDGNNFSPDWSPYPKK